MVRDSLRPSTGCPAGVSRGLASRADGSPSALYNMALARAHEKQAIPPLTPILDKLRLSAPLPEEWDPEKLSEQTLGGIDGWKARRQRNWGRSEVTDWAGSLLAAGDTSVWVRVRCVVGHPPQLCVEFNPAKLTAYELQSVGLFLWTHGADPDSVWVDRYDVAFDYRVPRPLLMLDDRLRCMDTFGIGPCGPQTARTGFRKGSRLKAQLYDKGAERASKGVHVDGDVTRFELQVWPLGHAVTSGSRSWENPPRLSELGGESWPGGAITVRALQYDPATISDDVFACGAALAHYSMRHARAFVKKRLGVKRLEVWEDSCVGEVRPSPRSVFVEGWRRTVDDFRDVFVRDSGKQFAQLLGGLAVGHA